MIHPTAIIHPKAQLDSTVEVGPYTVIDEHVAIGPDCKLGPHIYITGHTTIGSNNRFHAGCVIGDAPQDVKYSDLPTRLRIGDNNLFREHVTVHRSNKLEEDTVVGSNNFFMAHSHLAHNVVIGNNVIIANGALIAGHVTISDRAFVSGNCLVHQFVRIGTLALMQGGSRISKDLPPFTIARGANGICGLNVIGLRRAGFDSAQRLELKKLYHCLFRSENKFATSLEEARAVFATPAAKLVIEFVSSSKRGVCSDTSRGNLEEDGEV